MSRRGRTILLVAASLAVVLAGAGWLLAPRFAAVAEQANEAANDALDTLSDAYHAGTVAKRLLDDKPERVLVLFQNSWELRPTGGFITALGEGTIVRGRIEDLQVVASDAYDIHQNLTPPMPEPMQAWISTPHLMLRDANWDPDYPTSAANVARLYEDATGLHPDIVLAVTTGATEALVHATGPITFAVNGHEIAVDETSVTATLEQLTDVDFATLGLTKTTRKQILAKFAEALLPRVELHMSQDPVGALALATQLAANYDLQLWAEDSSLDSHLEALDARREVAPRATSGNAANNGDTLLVVDTNLNSYKTDPFVTRAANYDVAIDEAGQATATLRMTYTNTSTSADRLATTYHDYVRVYVPYGSELAQSSGFSDGAGPSSTSRHGRTVFGGILEVPQGASTTLTLVYTLPRSAVASLAGYSLNLERQPGSVPFALTVTVQQGNLARTLTGATDRDTILR